MAIVPDNSSGCQSNLEANNGGSENKPENGSGPHESRSGPHADFHTSFTELDGMVEVGLVVTPLLPIVREVRWCSTTRQYEEVPLCPCYRNPSRWRRCPDPGKHPVHGWSDPSALARTAADVFRLFDRPDYNIAIHCGESRIVVVDADARRGGLESLERLKRDFNLPPTWGDDRGGQSPHLYFNEPKGWRQLRLKASIETRYYPGVEFLSGNHLCNIGGSDHEDGIRREWLPGCAPYDRASIVSTLPRRLVEYVNRVVPMGRLSRTSYYLPSAATGQNGASAPAGVDGDDDLCDIKRAARIVAKAEDKEAEIRRMLDAGEFPRIHALRNNTLFYTACSLHWYGIDEDVIAEVVGLMNEYVCHKPMDDDRVKGVLESAASYDYGATITEDDLKVLCPGEKKQELPDDGKPTPGAVPCTEEEAEKNSTPWVSQPHFAKKKPKRSPRRTPTAFKPAYACHNLGSALLTERRPRDPATGRPIEHPIGTCTEFVGTYACGRTTKCGGCAAYARDSKHDDFKWVLSLENDGAPLGVFQTTDEKEWAAFDKHQNRTAQKMGVDVRRRNYYEDAPDGTTVYRSITPIPHPKAKPLTYKEAEQIDRILVDTLPSRGARRSSVRDIGRWLQEKKERKYERVTATIDDCPEIEIFLRSVGAEVEERLCTRGTMRRRLFVTYKTEEQRAAARQWFQDRAQAKKKARMSESGGNLSDSDMGERIRRRLAQWDDNFKPEDVPFYRRAC